MKKVKQKTIVRLFHDAPAPPPPDDLLPRLKEEIPEEILVSGINARPEETDSGSRARTPLFSLAAILVLICAGVLAGYWIGNQMRLHNKHLNAAATPETKPATPYVPSRGSPPVSGGTAPVIHHTPTLNDTFPFPFSGAQVFPAALSGSFRGDDPSGSVRSFVNTRTFPRSSFSLDVEPVTYRLTQHYIQQGALPPKEAVRSEDFINYFDPGEHPPEGKDFSVSVEGASFPFSPDPDLKIVRFNIRARDRVEADGSPDQTTIVLNVDRGKEDKQQEILLFTRAFPDVLRKLGPSNQIKVIVSPAGPVPVAEDLEQIFSLAEEYELSGEAAKKVSAGNGMKWIQQNGEPSAELPGRVEKNIIILSGTPTRVDEEDFIPRRKFMKKISRDATGSAPVNVQVEHLEDFFRVGEAHTLDIPSPEVFIFEEARQNLVNAITRPIRTVATDARVEVKFNPDAVERYRFIGSSRALPTGNQTGDNGEDFIFSCDIEAGHSATAFYEIKIKPNKQEQMPVAELRLTYRPVRESDRVVEIRRTVFASEVSQSWAQASSRFKFTALVAQYSKYLKEEERPDPEKLLTLLRRARSLRGKLHFGEKVEEFISLVDTSSRIAQTGSRETKTRKEKTK